MLIAKTMLTSSDAKWRCMWQMLVWSINLSLVCQFLHIGSHVVFYIIAALSILILPVLTAIYSNTSGRHGAGLLRAGLVFCDPVLACITVTPSMLLNQLPGLVDEYACLRLHKSWNSSVECVLNHSDIQNPDWYMEHIGDSEAMRQLLIIDKKRRYLIVEGAIVTPVLLALLMCKRTRKMRYSTFLVSCAYWLVMAVEAISLMENVLLEDAHKHIVYTTEAMISIVSILCASYAIITLISYLSPVTSAERTEKSENEKFDFLYCAFVGTVAVMCCEVPLIVARFRMIARDEHYLLPGTFYVWLIKDIAFVPMILMLVYGPKYGNKYLRLPCKSYDKDTMFHFEPEKRDRYVYQHRKDARYSKVARDDIKLKDPAEKNAEPASLTVSTEINGVKKVRSVSKTEQPDETDARVKCSSEGSTAEVHKVTDDTMVKYSKKVSLAERRKGEDDARVKCKNVGLAEGRKGADAKKKRGTCDAPAENGTLYDSKSCSDGIDIPMQDLAAGKTKQSRDLSAGERHRSHRSPPEKGSTNKHHPVSGKHHSPKNSLPDKGVTVTAWSSDSEYSDDEIVMRKTKRADITTHKSPTTRHAKPKSKTEPDSEESPPKDSKRVMFQFDIGEGKALTVKSRSDSPGVVIDAQGDSMVVSPRVEI